MVSQVSQQQMAGHAQSQVNTARNQILNGSSFGQILRKGIFFWYLVQVGICSGPPCVWDRYGFVPG